MKHLWAAVALALGALVPASAAAQGTTSPPPARERTTEFELGQNYPNPFNPSTTIPFTVGDYPACSESGRDYRVSLQIYNILAQLIAVPVLDGSGGGQPASNASLRCGRYTAYWDGRTMDGGSEVPSGVYLYRLVVDGKPAVKKMIIVR